MQGVFWGGVVAIAIMFAFFLAVGVWAGRKVHRSPSELLLAGRACRCGSRC